MNHLKVYDPNSDEDEVADANQIESAATSDDRVSNVIFFHFEALTASPISRTSTVKAFSTSLVPDRTDATP